MTTPTSQETPMTSLAFTTGAREFAQTLARISTVSHRDTDLPSINGILLDPTPSGLVAVATDRFRLAVTRVAASGIDGDAAFLPLDHVKRIVATWKTARADTVLTVTTTPGDAAGTARWEVSATDGTAIGFTAHIDGHTVPWRKLIAPHAPLPDPEAAIAPASIFNIGFVESLFKLRVQPGDDIRFRISSPIRPMSAHIGDHTIAILMPIRSPKPTADPTLWIVDAIAETPTKELAA